MRDRRIDRFILLPFSVGCVSESSVAVYENQPKRAQRDGAPNTPSGDGDRRQSTVEVKNSSAVLAFPKPNISAGIQKLVKSFKSLSQHVVVLYKDEDEEVEMEIGFPTDVQHVAHIGCDGFNSSMSGNKNWDRAPELLPLPSSMQQYELAVAAQAGAPPPYGPRASWPQ
ncbi:unnamed protein product [Musa acuminata subsp. malaccensis]|uniref:(wild Malaysian banana) hypothetical protein n=1 Tax=Musa acuminata subsp. malaccensis TaxID=214687 RepID=A0A804L1G7_MUSAM|nr:PREDICTED: CRIB domain-containing protein RIC4-like [Musa acuminata subsp. malaccensis]CAG1854909.1 unnamed protein product [Musa acuminata subsp. malaccensis]